MTCDYDTLTLERLQEILSYNPDTGVFLWVKPRAIRHNVGDIAGGIDARGYRRIVVFGRSVAAYRLAWFFSFGTWPPEDVDHINGIRSDDRLANLRLASRSQNNCNRGPQKNNRTGYIGVHPDHGTYRARINFQRRRINIGNFPTADAAARAYDAEAKRLHGEFARLNFGA